MKEADTDMMGNSCMMQFFFLFYKRDHGDICDDWRVMIAVSWNTRYSLRRGWEEQGH